MGKRTALWTATGLGRAFLALFVAGISVAPAHADLRSAYSDYKNGDYTHAFSEFLALAKLGQPQAQFVVAEMYRAGQGADASDIHAYAWASLAAANGVAQGKVLAESIRPALAPGSDRIAGWVTLAYTHSALERTLLPDLSSASAQAPDASSPGHVADCNRKEVRLFRSTYPVAARTYAVEGAVLAEFVLMSDGHPRFPHIIYAVPGGVFEDAVRGSLLRSRFSVAPQGSPPVRCLLPYNFTLSSPLQTDDGSDGGPRFPAYWQTEARAGDSGAQLLYGLMRGERGVPWLVKAAQAGLPAAQYELAHDLLLGEGCRKDKAKALRWLSMAADQDQPDADLALATRMLRGTPTDSDVAQAKAWLERAAGQGAGQGSQKWGLLLQDASRWPTDSLDHAEGHSMGDGRHAARLLLAAILAATPQPGLRDPTRALQLLSEVDSDGGDPTPFEIRAAAQAAEGDYTQATLSEGSAISRAHRLGWDLSPLEQRLASYRSGKPWYGSLIRF